MRLYLASQSPRRSELLQAAGIPFELIENTLDESSIDLDTSNVEKTLKLLTQKKAESVISPPKGLILSADTILYFDATFLGKPATLADAAIMLRQLSGKTHQVWTAVCLWDTISNTHTFHLDHATVTFKPLSDTMIQHYITHYPVLDKAGSYAIQDIGDQFIQSVEGDPQTIIGLPVTQLAGTLKNYGILSTHSS